MENNNQLELMEELEKAGKIAEYIDKDKVEYNEDKYIEVDAVGAIEDEYSKNIGNKYKRTRKRATDKKYKDYARVKNKISKNETNQLKAYKLRKKVTKEGEVKYYIKKGKNQLTKSINDKEVTNKKLRIRQEDIGNGSIYKKIR